MVIWGIGRYCQVLAAGVRVTEIYVDTVGKEEHYQAKLEEIFPQLKVMVCSKADDKFPICGAASICTTPHPRAAAAAAAALPWPVLNIPRDGASLVHSTAPVFGLQLPAFSHALRLG